MQNSLSKNKQLNNALSNRRNYLILKQINFSGIFGIVAACLLAYLIVSENGDLSIIIWVIIDIMIILFRLLFFKSIQTKITQRQQRKKIHKLISYLIPFNSGLSWGIAIYLFLPNPANIELFITFLAITSINITLNIPAFSPSLPCCISFSVPIMLGLLIRIIELEFYQLFLGYFLFFIFLGILAYWLNQIMKQSVHLDLENQKLVDNLSTEKEIAIQASKEKSQFIAATSHDLRQPLNSLGLFIYSLRTRLGQISDKSTLSVLNNIDNSYQALNNLFDSLLEISHLDAGTLKIEKKTIHTDTILRPLCDEMREQAYAKGLKLFYKGCDSFVYTDPVLLSRAIRNLLSNAIKYTTQGQIDILEEMDNDFVHIKIIDTGIGIPEEEFNRIFNEYHQIANRRRDSRRGVGLGLSIVKKTCDLLACKVTVTSQLNQGSVFTIRIARSNGSEVEFQPITPTKHLNLKGLIVLVIDDDPDILVAMKLLLNSWHCQVYVAKTYQQAFSSVKQTKPDIILCDYRLQDDMTGIEALELISKKIEQTIPALMITGETGSETLKLIQAKGYSKLSKPIQPLQLKSAITVLLNQN